MKKISYDNVYVITPGKCGTQTISFGINKYTNQNYKFKNYNKLNLSHSLLDLKNVLNTNNNLIITGIRNPVDRNLSSFFQFILDNKIKYIQMNTKEYL